MCVCVYVFACAFLTQKVPNTVSTMKACTETCMSEIIPDGTGAVLTLIQMKDFHKNSMKHMFMCSHQHQNGGKGSLDGAHRLQLLAWANQERDAKVGTTIAIILK